MSFTFNIEVFAVRCPQVDNSGATLKLSIEELHTIINTSDKKIAKASFIPMMQARRLKAGSRAAADLASEMLQYDPQFVVFSSRHGELERCYSILTTLARNEDISPTDFAMSVHNAAVGAFTIINKTNIPCSSISAGNNSFIQALIEGIISLQDYKKVLVVDFEGMVPDIYAAKCNLQHNFPYATSFILTSGTKYHCEKIEKTANDVAPLPQSLCFANFLARNESTTTIKGFNEFWQITKNT